MQRIHLQNTGLQNSDHPLSPVFRILPPGFATGIARERLLLVVLLLVLIPLLFRSVLSGVDPVGYYSWVRSGVMDRDLDTTDEYRAFGNDDLTGRTRAGYNPNPYAIGAPLLWLPFFMLAHGIESVRLPASQGYETTYVVLVSLASLLYGFCAILVLHGIASELFGPRAATLAAIGGWLATPLVFYTYCHPLMSHAADAFGNALVMLAWYRLRPSPRSWFAFGAATGVAMLIRPQNALLIVPAAVEWVQLMQGTVRRASPAECPNTNRSAGLALVYGLGLLVMFLPQMATWRVVYGHWLEWNPYAYSNAGHFHWNPLPIGRVLLSTDRGLFVWSPILVFAVAGLVPLWRGHRRLGLFALWSLVGQVVLVSMWSSPGGGSAFGARVLLNNVPAYILGLAAFIDRLRHRAWSDRTLAVCVAAFVAWNFLLIAQYATGTIPRAGPVAPVDMLVGQLTVLPTQSDRIVEALLTRR
jgi:hypothetical protein